jgi:putative lipoic acid-binding regulatory protein
MIEIEGKPDISYPTKWGYKVIGTDEEVLRKAVDSVLTNFEYSLKFSNKSSKGKFISLTISIIVQDENERNSIFNNLKNHTTIKMVI